MSNLTTFNQDGIEIYIDNTTGESFASISGYSRMSGVSKSTVHNRLKGCSETDLKTAEILTRGGLQSVRLISFSLVLNWLSKDNPDYYSQLSNYLISNGNIRNFKYDESNLKNKNKIKPEAKVVNTLLSHSTIDYVKEYRTPIGNIDILTDKYIIEVKNWKASKHALGQLQAYKIYHKDKIPVAILFGKGLRVADYSTIKSMFDYYSIESEYIFDIPTYIKVTRKYFSNVISDNNISLLNNIDESLFLSN